MINTLIYLSLTLVIIVLPDKPPKITDKLLSRNIGIVLLDLENAPRESKESLENLLNDASINVPLQKTPREKLQYIHNLLKRDLFYTYRMNDLIGKGMKEGYLDCDNLSLLYVAIAEELKLPISIYLLPDHAFVVWRDSVDVIEWETVLGVERQKGFYAHAHNITEQSIKNGAYLRPLTRHEIIGYYLSVIGKVLLAERRMKVAQSYIDEGYSYAPDVITVIISKIDLSLMQKDYKEGIHYLNQALKLDPDNQELLYSLSQAYISSGNREEGIRVLQGLIDKNPYQPQVFLALSEVSSDPLPLLKKSYMLKGMDLDIGYKYASVLYSKGFLKESLMIITKLIQENPFDPRFYILRFEIELRNNDNLLAERDLNSAVSMGIDKDTLKRYKKTLKIAKKRAIERSLTQTSADMLIQ